MKTWILYVCLSGLAAAQTIEGDVVDAITGAPVAGAYVSGLGGTNVPIVRTDSAGHFTIPAAAAATPFAGFRVIRAGYIPNFRTVPSDQSRLNQRVELMPQAVIHGKVTDEDGVRVEGARVEILRYQFVEGERKLSGVVMPEQTDDLGEYRIAGLPAGRYYIRVSSPQLANWDGRYGKQFSNGSLEPDEAGVVEVKAGEERVVNPRLMRREGVTVSGRVEYPPGMVRDTRSVRAPVWVGELEIPPAWVGPDGAFVVRHVTPGSYRLRVGNWSLKPGELWGEQVVQVGDADIRNVVLTVREVQPVDIGGKVVVEGGGQPPRMQFGLRPSSGNGISAASGEDGAFVLKGLMPGHYDMQIVPDRPWPPQPSVHLASVLSATMGGSDVLRRGFDIGSGPPGPMEVVVTMKTIFVKGTLLGAAGEPVLGKLVVFVQGGRDMGSSVTQALGSFGTAFHRAGEYRIYVLPDQNQWQLLSDPDYLKAHENDFPPVRIVDGENPSIMLRMPPAKDRR